jgi:hypothetical protein
MESYATDAKVLDLISHATWVLLMIIKRMTEEKAKEYTVEDQFWFREGVQLQWRGHK